MRAGARRRAVPAPVSICRDDTARCRRLPCSPSGGWAWPGSPRIGAIRSQSTAARDSPTRENANLQPCRATPRRGIANAHCRRMVSATLPLGMRNGAVVPLARPARRASRFGDYDIVTPLARGGMGGVYLAVHAWTGERGALKVLDSQYAG